MCVENKTILTKLRCRLFVDIVVIWKLYLFLLPLSPEDFGGQGKNSWQAVRQKTTDNFSQFFYNNSKILLLKDQPLL